MGRTFTAPLPGAVLQATEAGQAAATGAVLETVGDALRVEDLFAGCDTFVLPLVAAVSGNPLTFARDARTLSAAGFRLDWVQVVDQFRWSPHVELAARFCR